MNAPGGCSPSTSGDLLAAFLDALLVDQRFWDAVQRRIDNGLARGAGADPEWVSRARAARLAGAGASTIRDWQRAGKLSKGHRGRVNVAELRQLLAGRATQRVAAQLPPSPVDTRARSVAAEIRAAVHGGRR